MSVVGHRHPFDTEADQGALPEISVVRVVLDQQHQTGFSSAGFSSTGFGQDLVLGPVLGPALGPALGLVLVPGLVLVLVFVLVLIVVLGRIGFLVILFQRVDGWRTRDGGGQGEPEAAALPRALSTPIWPSWRSTTRLQIASPRPVPI